MVRRPHLSIVPAYAVRPHGLPSFPRVAGLAAVGCVLLGLLYLAARETPLFAVRTLEISGVPPAVRTEIARVAARYVGESLVALDADELQHRLEALPSVRSIRSDRAFPHTLRLFVVPEQPVAVVRSGADTWLVSARGRVIRRLPRSALGKRPRVRVGGRLILSPGQTVTDRAARLALRVVTAVPPEFPVRIRSVRARNGQITVGLGGGAELRLGAGSAIALKLAAAARVLESLSLEERTALGYLDLRVPDRAVAADKSQLSG